MAYQHGDAALAYIVAHEYAHAMQTAYGFQPRITPISELQADCLAGVYIGCFWYNREPDFWYETFVFMVRQ